MDDLNARVFFGKNVAELGAEVGGAVVDEDDFEILVSLSEDRVDATFKNLGDVVNRDDDRDERRRGHAASLDFKASNWSRAAAMVLSMS